MQWKSTSPISFAAGTALGGLLVGISEGLYREVPLLYSGLLYGTIWAITGLGAAAALRLVLPKPPKSLWAWGLSSSVSLSFAVLGRFVLLRDILKEAPGAGIKAAALAIALAAITGIVLFGISRPIALFFEQKATALLTPCLTIVGFTILAQGSGTSPALKIPENKTPPNQGVILIVVDTLRADALGIYGGLEPTPTLDAFGKGNIIFTDMSAQASWTKPAMASIHASRHASGHNTISKTDALPEQLTTLAEVLQKKKIQTGAVVTNYNLEESYGFSQGFDHYAYLPPDRYLGAPARANRLAAYNVYRLLREKLLSANREARHFYQEAPTVNQNGLAILDSMDPSKPFFLWLHYMEPHDPYFASDGTSIARVSTPHPTPDMASKMQSAYQEDVGRFDAAFRSLLDELKKRNLDNVAIVLTSDHGEEFNEHGGFYHGVTLYEEQLKLPLLIKTQSQQSGVRTDLARQIDIAPTIAGMLGLTAPAEWEGRDLLSNSLPPSHTIAEEDHQGNILRSIRLSSSPKLKLILANEENPRGLSPIEYYDLDQDPREKTPLEKDITPLQTALTKQQHASQQGGVLPQQRDLDPEAEAELRSLGYIE